MAAVKPEPESFWGSGLWHCFFLEMDLGWYGLITSPFFPKHVLQQPKPHTGMRMKLGLERPRKPVLSPGTVQVLGSPLQKKLHAESQAFLQQRILSHRSNSCIHLLPLGQCILPVYCKKLQQIHIHSCFINISSDCSDLCTFMLGLHFLAVFLIGTVLLNLVFIVYFIGLLYWFIIIDLVLISSYFLGFVLLCQL